LKFQSIRMRLCVSFCELAHCTHALMSQFIYFASLFLIALYSNNLKLFQNADSFIAEIYIKLQ